VCVCVCVCVFRERIKETRNSMQLPEARDAESCFVGCEYVCVCMCVCVCVCMYVKSVQLPEARDAESCFVGGCVCVCVCACVCFERGEKKQEIVCSCQRPEMLSLVL
jgi:hypothetical protein